MTKDQSTNEFEKTVASTILKESDNLEDRIETIAKAENLSSPAQLDRDYFNLFVKEALKEKEDPPFEPDDSLKVAKTAAALRQKVLNSDKLEKYEFDRSMTGNQVTIEFEGGCLADGQISRVTGNRAMVEVPVRADDSYPLIVDGYDPESMGIDPGPDFRSEDGVGTGNSDVGKDEVLAPDFDEILSRELNGDADIQALAEAVDLPENRIREMMSGTYRPKMEVLRQIENHLGVSLTTTE